MALPAGPAVTAHASATTNDGHSRAAAVVTVTASSAAVVNASVTADYETSPTPEQRKKVRMNTIILIAAFVVLFILASAPIWPFGVTFVGATCVAIGGFVSIRHRLMEESNVPLKDDYKNFPLAWVGVGGVLVAADAFAPAWSIITAWFASYFG